MARIESSVEIAAPQARVWEAVSDLDSEPKYWKGTRSVRNISRDGNRVTREVTMAFRDQRCTQEVLLEPPSRVLARFTGGVIAGTKEITLGPAGGGTLMRTVWDIRMAGVMGVFTGMVSRHVRKGTEQAMRAIKEEIEADV